MAFMHFGNFLEGMRLSAADIADREKSELNRRYMDEQMQTMQLAREMNRDELGYRPELRARDAEQFGMDRTRFKTEQTDRELALAMNPAIAGIEADLNPTSVQAAIDANIAARKTLGLPVDPALEGLRVSAGKDGSFVFTPRGPTTTMQGPALTRPGAPVLDPATGKVAPGPAVTGAGPTVQMSYDGAPAIVPRENAREFVYKLWTGKMSPEKEQEAALKRAQSGGGASSDRPHNNPAYQKAADAAAKAYAKWADLNAKRTGITGKLDPDQERKIAAAEAEYLSLTNRLRDIPPMMHLGVPLDEQYQPWVPRAQRPGAMQRPGEDPAVAAFLDSALAELAAVKAKK